MHSVDFVPRFAVRSTLVACLLCCLLSQVLSAPLISKTVSLPCVPCFMIFMDAHALVCLCPLLLGLRNAFSRCPGFRRLSFRAKSNGPIVFVEFDDVHYATRALQEMYGNTLGGMVKGGIRLSYSKVSTEPKPTSHVSAAAVLTHAFAPRCRIPSAFVRAVVTLALSRTLNKEVTLVHRL